MNLSLPGVHGRSVSRILILLHICVAAGQAPAAGQRTAVLGGVCQSASVIRKSDLLSFAKRERKRGREGEREGIERETDSGSLRPHTLVV